MATDGIPLYRDCIYSDIVNYRKEPFLFDPDIHHASDSSTVPKPNSLVQSSLPESISVWYRIHDARRSINSLPIFFFFLQLILADTLDTHKLRLEDERRAAGDGADAAVAVAVLGRDGELALLADAHVQEALVPSDGMTHQ